jgi:hypothetical protein
MCRLSKTAHHPVVLVLLIAILLLVVSANPVAAATKVLDVKFQNVQFSIPIGPGVVSCTPADTTARITFRETHITQWDNGQFQLYQYSSLDILTASGTRTGGLASSFHTANGVGGLPQTFQQTLLVTCNGAGKAGDFHFGFTIGEDGTITEVHGP